VQPAGRDDDGFLGDPIDRPMLLVDAPTPPALEPFFLLPFPCDRAFSQAITSFRRFIASSAGLMGVRRLNFRWDTACTQYPDRHWVHEVSPIMTLHLVQPDAQRGFPVACGRWIGPQLKQPQHKYQ